MSILRQYIRLVEEETIPVPNEQQSKQRARELAQQMGIDPNNIKVKSRGGVPVEINGKPVPTNLYKETEIRLMAAAQQLSTGNTAPRQTPGIVPPDSPMDQQNKQQPTTATQADVRKVDNAIDKPTSGDPKVAALQQDLKAAGADLGPFENDGVDGLMGKYTRAAMAKFPEITAKHPEAAKMPDAPPGSGKAIKGGQRTKPPPETDTDGGSNPKPKDPNPADTTKPADTKPTDPNAVRPEVKAMAELLDKLVKQAQLKESQRNDPTEQIKKYKSIVERADQNIDEYTNNSWIGEAAATTAAPAATTAAAGQSFGQKALGGLKTAGNIARTAGNFAKKAAPFIGAGVGLWGLVDQGRQIQRDFEEGDLGSAALGTLSGLAYALSIPAKLTPFGITLGLGGYVAGAAADARRAGRGGRKVVDMVDQIQAKLKDPDNGFTPAESKLLGDKVAQVRAQLIRNNIPIDL